MSATLRKSTAILDRLTIGIFVVLLAAPFVSRQAGWAPAGESGEKRRLASFPELGASVSAIQRAPARFDAYFKDRFGFRNQLIRWHSMLYVLGLHVSPSPLVVLGREDWLFYNGLPRGDGDNISDYRRARPLSRAWLERWRWTFEDLQEWMAHRDIPFLIVIVPAKGFVYSEFLPSDLSAVGEWTPVEQVKRYCQSRSDLHLLDLTEPLVAGRADAEARWGSAERVFFKTDSHWNVLGAYYGYRTLMRRLRKWAPTLQPEPLSQFERVQLMHQGDLAQLIALGDVLAEPFTNLRPLKSRQAKWSDLSKGHRPDVAAVVQGSTAPRLLMYRDSFAGHLIPFLSEHFSRSYYRWNEHGFDARLVQRERPDLVILQMSNRRLREGLRYSMSIVEEAAERRFELAEDVVARYTGKGLQHLQPLQAVTTLEKEGDLIVETTGPGPHVALPAFSGTGSELPLIRLELSAPAATELQLSWSRRVGDAPDDGIPARTSSRIKAGRHAAYFAIKDPEVAGSVRLRLGQHGGRYRIHGVEIRTIPR